ncbi:MAG: phenylalanine--tRNA ligase subunit beta [Acidobacteria bacterium]|nr:phenylalanine--tRNA ligase subunit beta [Acidobacteriota bacterium]
MIISYNWLRELTGIEWTPEELRARLTGAGLEVESLEAAAAGGDHVLGIAVLSNRPDWMSHLGVAREVGVMTGRGVSWPPMTPKAVAGSAEDFASVELRAADLCPRFTARVVRGVKVGPSPAWLAARLEAVGLRPINNVADITNFVMLELGQPLHAFDLDKLTARRIVVRRAEAGETLRTLDGVERKLDAEMLVIADEARAVAVAGVMGGAETEISDGTQNVLVECAYFAPASVRRTARALNLQTDASDRFERGVDFDGLLRAQARVVTLITELAGGAASADAIDAFPERIAPDSVPLRFERVRALTGLDVEPREAARILGALGFHPTAGGANGSGVAGVGAGATGGALDASSLRPGAKVSFTAPTWRTDVRIEEDLVEEVARHFGFDKIESALSPSSEAGEYRAHEGRRRAARRALASRGFDEAINFSFIDAAHDAEFDLIPDLVADSAAGLDDDEGGAGDARFVTLVNPIIEGASRMRPTLLPGLLASVRHNFNPAPVAGSERPVERESIALVATGGATEAGSAAAPRELDFYDLKGALEAAAEAMRLPRLGFAPAAARHLREGQAARVSLGGREVGRAGRLSDGLAASYKFRQPVYVAELSLGALLASGEEPVRYAPLARFPAVVRDVTLAADRRSTFEEMRRAALSTDAEHLRSVALVYVYEGERVPEGRRSVTLRLEYRADDRTLRDEEVDELHARIVAALAESFGAG